MWTLGMYAVDCHEATLKLHNDDSNNNLDKDFISTTHDSLL